MRTRLTILAAALFAVPNLAVAQGIGGPRRGGGLPPIQIKLTKDSVQRLLVAIPEITKHTSKQQAKMFQSMGNPMAMPELPPEEIQKLHTIFVKHGFTIEEFAMQVSALVATYLALSPDALDKQLPSKDKPEIQAILTNPKIPEAQKDALRAQIAFAQQNKGKIRKQLTALASEHNKKVVRPMLSRVQTVFEQAAKEARKAMSKAALNPKAPKKGPRR